MVSSFYVECGPNWKAPDMLRNYPDKFRSRAVALVRAGQTVTKAADDLGVTSSCLYGWVKQDRISRGEIPGVATVESR